MKQFVVVNECDRCGSKEDVKTVPLGMSREFDACASCREVYKTAVQPFLSLSRQVPKRRVARKAPTKPTHGWTMVSPTPTPVVRPPLTAADLRDWARSEGFNISDRGRIPVFIQQAYHRANV